MELAERPQSSALEKSSFDMTRAWTSIFINEDINKRVKYVTVLQCFLL